VSQAVQATLLSSIYHTVGSAGQPFGRAAAVRLDNNYIMLTVCNVAEVGGSLVQSPDYRFCALLHSTTGRWTNFSSNATSSRTPVNVFRSTDHAALFDGNRVVSLDAVTTLERVSNDNLGKDQTILGATRIPAKWYSRLIDLATPTHKAQLHRILMSFNFVIAGVPQGGANGWYVSLVRGDGSVAVPEFRVPVRGDPAQILYRLTKELPAFPEVNDVQLRVEWRTDTVEGTVPTVLSAEIYNTTLEFQRARQSDNA
jgi:hypothetical protein